MKKAIQVISLFLLVGLGSFTTISCVDSVNKNASTVDASGSSTVQVYYFHATRRCATCEAVEKVTKETLTENYGAKVPFQSINREEEKENPLVKKYEISGQTLLVVKGDQVVNLTNDAFMYARTSPDKLKAKIKETIDALL